MVDDRERGEVSLAYLEWFHNQAIPEQRPDRSIRHAVDWEEEIEVRVRETRREVAQEFQSRIDILQEDKSILETAMDIQQADFEREKAQWARDKQALKAQIRKKNIVTTAQQQEEREAQFRVVRDHERRGFSPLVQGLREQIGGVESSKESQIAEFEIERHHYQKMINQLEAESLEVRRHKDMALDRERDALDLAETRDLERIYRNVGGPLQEQAP
ncbi:PREDICTED: meiosis-specific nuclear structural protein 1-like [Nicotiana attenuata]|uniref:meiosis-specific nuclear structural protein 1-like n=1 Tax=Nicotiana attenuata TaxID=49451 RepID=UPI000904B9C8|nr:PREDICTED: meiosis-specific nuclear structural protein 1-like [Nicotiana attenuata]